MKSRRGFSSTEVLVATGIFAVALIPVITLIGGGARPTAFTEYHQAAQAAATQAADRVQDLILSRGFAELEKMPVGEKIAAAETKLYKLPPDDEATKTAEGGWVNAPEVSITSLGDGAALVQISAVVNWSVPGDATKHAFTLSRLLSRPEIGLVSDYQPRQVPGGASK